MTLASLPKVSRATVINEHEETVVAERFRKDMHIKAPSVRATTGNLSGGNQQKVVLSKWIFADPDVLILDDKSPDPGWSEELEKICEEEGALYYCTPRNSGYRETATLVCLRQ